MLPGNKNFKQIFILVFLLLNQVTIMKSSSVDLSGKLNQSNTLNYPVPPNNPRMLFYLQRNINNNAIVYETNILEAGQIDRKAPIHVYWIRYSTDSTRAELTYIQRKYAYGVESREIEGKPGHFIHNFVSYPKKKFYLIPDREGKKYQALTSIQGKMAILESVFIQLSGGTFWFPSIDYIEMKGRDPLTKEIVIEQFVP